MLLQLKNLTFTFAGRNHLLNNISLNLEPGKIYALMGTNGSGKTTLFNIISGFIKAHSGNIVFNDSDITDKKPYRINQLGICRTFQDLRLITKLTVKENVVLAMRNNPTDKWLNSLVPAKVFKNKLAEMDSLADKILNSYFLMGVTDSFAGEISFGQQKLLTLACCAANGADLFLLDEPAAGINPEYMKIIGSLLKQLKEAGKTILFIEHSSDFIADTADRIFFLNEGNLSEYNTINEMSNDAYVKEAYL